MPYRGHNVISACLFDILQKHDPLTNVGLMLGQRRKRWPISKPALLLRLVPALHAARGE